MKKKIVVLALFILLISGCGSKIPKLSNGKEAVVTFKSGSKISVDDLYSKLKENYALEALVNMADKKILEKEYKGKVKESKEYVENQIAQYEATFGDKLEETIQSQTGYTLEGYKDLMYIYHLRDYAIKDYSKDQVSEKDIKKYYDEEIVGDIKISHILITSKAKDDMTDEEKEAQEKEAKAKAENIIKELKATKKANLKDKFAELAKEYSEDETSKDNGGSLGFINKDTLSSEYTDLVNKAYKLKDGEYSTSVITTELGYHIVLRLETKEKAALKEVKDNILDELGTKYLEENPEANVKALQEIRKEYGFEIVDTEIKAKYATYIQNQLAYYQQQKK